MLSHSPDVVTRKVKRRTTCSMFVRCCNLFVLGRSPSGLLSCSASFSPRPHPCLSLLHPVFFHPAMASSSTLPGFPLPPLIPLLPSYFSPTLLFSSPSRKLEFANAKPPPSSVPWTLLLTHPAVWALVVCHVVSTNCFYILLSWLPTFFHELYPDAKGKMRICMMKRVCLMEL